MIEPYATLHMVITYVFKRSLLIFLYFFLCFAALCVAFAYSKAVEIMERVFSISEGKDPDLVQCIDPFELHKKFEDKFPEVLSINCLTRDYGLHRVLHTALILRSEGITKEKVGHFYVCIIIFLTICYWTSVSDTIC